MKKLILLKIVLLAFAFTTSCGKDSTSTTTTTTTTTTPTTTPTTISTPTFDAIKGDANFSGNLFSDTVVLYLQGGPVPIFSDDDVKEIINANQTTKVLYAHVHQVQTQSPEKIKDTDITFEEGKQLNDESILILKRVIDYFKGQGKKVYIIGISYGTFITQELIADYGIDVADGYLIGIGRLDMDDEIWMNLSKGKFVNFSYAADGSYTVTDTGISPLDNEEANLSERTKVNLYRLSAGLISNRYTERLKDISDLSKITYIHADRDKAVGPLSLKERTFLTDRNVKLVPVAGNHNDGGVEIIKLLRTTFQLE